MNSPGRCYVPVVFAYDDLVCSSYSILRYNNLIHVAGTIKVPEAHVIHAR
jgi:hypothetical protein